MVIKTDTCFFSEMKIYPGHGKRLVRKDGKLLSFLNQKGLSLYLQKKKNLKLVWTQAWRRAHKKGKVEAVARKRVKRAAKTFKAIQGLAIDDLKKKRSVTAEAKKAQRDQSIRELKEKKRKATEDKKKAPKGKGAAAPKPTVFERVPKSSRKMMQQKGGR